MKVEVHVNVHTRKSHKRMNYGSASLSLGALFNAQVSVLISLQSYPVKLLHGIVSQISSNWASSSFNF